MSELVGKLGVVFRTLVGSGTTQAGNPFQKFRGDDGRLYEMEYDAGCIGVMLTDLQMQVGKTEPEKVQPLEVSEIQTARFEDGSPMLLLRMPSGSIALKFLSGDVRKLIDELEKLGAPPSKTKN